jgi:hypothetical protein
MNEKREPRIAAASQSTLDSVFRPIGLAIVMLAAIAVLFGSLAIPSPQYEPVGGALIPQAAAILVLLTCGTVSIQHARRRTPSRSSATSDRNVDVLRLTTFLIATGLYAVALSSRSIGFGIGTALYISTLFVTYERPSVRSALLSIAVIAVFSFALELLFTRIFVVDLVSSF